MCTRALSKYLNVTVVEEAKKPLQEMIVAQEKELASLRKRMDVVIEQLKEHEETFDLVTREFGNVIICLLNNWAMKQLLEYCEKPKKDLKRKGSRT